MSSIRFALTLNLMTRIEKHLLGRVVLYIKDELAAARGEDGTWGSAKVNLWLHCWGVRRKFSILFIIINMSACCGALFNDDRYFLVPELLFK